jgi:hypothetical protein
MKKHLILIALLLWMVNPVDSKTFYPNFKLDISRPLMGALNGGVCPEFMFSYPLRNEILLDFGYAGVWYNRSNKEDVQSSLTGSMYKFGVSKRFFKKEEKMLIGILSLRTFYSRYNATFTINPYNSITPVPVTIDQKGGSPGVEVEFSVPIYGGNNYRIQTYVRYGKVFNPPDYRRYFGVYPGVGYWTNAGHSNNYISILGIDITFRIPYKIIRDDYLTE